MKQQHTKVLVIGSGIAGLFYAIKCAKFAEVTLITKGILGESNTRYAQGGISAVFADTDSIESHIHDTLLAGDGLCNSEAVRLIAEKARESILELDKLQVHFDKHQSGEFELHKEGGHSHARVVHATDATGLAVENALVRYIRTLTNVRIIENCFALDLEVENNACTGAIALANNQFLKINADVVMLACGGAGQVYQKNTNPEIATGDGFAMAYRAGAALSDMEFIQFHPTTLFLPRQPVFLITEALRGFGAVLVHKDGSSFMEKYHPLASLAPRDIVSRAIVSEMNQKNVSCVYLDATSFSETALKKHFPTIFSKCAAAGIHLYKDLIPVVPAAHYICGGVKTDLYARTSVRNLYACGEVACTGVHGANRLASNSLLEGLVFAANAAADTAGRTPQPKLTVHPEPRLFFCEAPAEELKNIRHNVQALMWKYAGIVRCEKELIHAKVELDKLHCSVRQMIVAEGISVMASEVQNLIETSQRIVSGALQRKESRGCHYRADYPQKDTEKTYFLQQLKPHVAE